MATTDVPGADRPGNPSRRTFLKQAPAAALAVTGAAATLPAAAPIAAPVPVDVQALSRAYRRAFRAYVRMYNLRPRCERAAIDEDPKLMMARFDGPSRVMNFIYDHGFDEPQDLASSCAHWRGADHKAAAHLVKHREEIRDLLDRHGWFSAIERVCRAKDRADAAYRSLMTAQVSGPADVLVKLAVGREPDFEMVDAGGGDQEEQLLVALWRDLSALAGRASA